MTFAGNFWLDFCIDTYIDFNPLLKPAACKQLTGR